MDSTRIKLTKLSDDNYSTWSYEMELLLKSKGLWKHTQTEWVKGEKDTLEGKAKQPDSLDQWEENDDRASALIGLNVSQKFYPVLKGKKSCFQIWNALLAEFTEILNGVKLMLKCQFYKARMQDGETLLKYLDCVLLIVDRLADLGCPTSNSETCYKILSSIPEVYKPITMSCMQMEEKDLTPSYLCNQFMLETT